MDDNQNNPNRRVGECPRRIFWLLPRTAIKPAYMITRKESLNEASQHLLEFVRKHSIQSLNVAGSRQQDFYQSPNVTLQFALLDREPAMRGGAVTDMEQYG